MIVDMEEDTVRSHFADCGTIDNIRIVRDSKTSLGKGFCYINFNVSLEILMHIIFIIYS